MKTLAAFYYRNELYIRLIPAKPLFNSTLVHEVVNRGDVFAMRVEGTAIVIQPVIPNTEMAANNAVNFPVIGL